MSDKSIFHFQMTEAQVSLRFTVEHNLENIDSLESDVCSRIFKNVYVDCSQLQPSLMSQAGRSLAKLARQIRRVDKDVVLVAAPADLMSTLKTQGTFGLFVFLRSASDNVDSEQPDSVKPAATAKTASAVPAGQKLDVNVINPFLISAVHVCQAQAAVKAKPGAPHRKTLDENLDGEFHGVISFDSKSFNGAVCISFPHGTLKAMICKIIGEERELTSKEVSSGAGELLNIIFTQAKATLNKDGHEVKAALPQITSDKKSPSMGGARFRQRVAIPFESEVGPFFIEIMAA